MISKLIKKAVEPELNEVRDSVKALNKKMDRILSELGVKCGKERDEVIDVKPRKKKRKTALKHGSGVFILRWEDKHNEPYLHTFEADTLVKAKEFAAKHVRIITSTTIGVKNVTFGRLSSHKDNGIAYGQRFLVRHRSKEGVKFTRAG